MPASNTSFTVSRRKATSRGYCLREFDRREFALDNSGDVTRLPAEQKKWDIHFTDVLYDARYPETVWCGFTSFAGDLLWTFDPKTKAFTSKGFLEHREEHETKIHRGSVFGPDGKLYFGTAGLVTLKQRHDAAGGRVFSYDPTTGKYEFICRPVPKDYVQTIAVDFERGLLYGTTYPMPVFFVWDMAKKKLIFQEWIDHLPHDIVIDDDGNAWCTYSLIPTLKRWPFFKYSPDTNKMTFTDLRPFGDRPEEDPICDSFVNGGDGFLYFGGGSGSLMRLEPRSMHLEQVFRAAPSRGFGAMTKPENGKIYGIAGTGATTEVLSYDTATGNIELFGPCYDDKRGTGIFRPHSMALGPNNCLYTPETDNSSRQCYFWETQLPS